MKKPIKVQEDVFFLFNYCVVNASLLQKCNISVAVLGTIRKIQVKSYMGISTSTKKYSEYYLCSK
jgi:hypothetical protein